MRTPELKIEIVNTSGLVPYAGNAKLHPDWQVEQIAESIKEFGNCDPIAVWTNAKGEPEIVEGHGRVLALRKLGIVDAPVVFLDHLTDEQRRAYVHVHNQTTLSSGFDFEALTADMAALDFDWEAFGFDPAIDVPGGYEPKPNEEVENLEYEEFVDKFKAKKTTDDCYTPPVVYDAVADWVAAEYGRDKAGFVRPFFPGGDYEAFDYPDGCTVVDNPPFSILAKIIRFYCSRGIPFFLFSPTLTLFRTQDCDITYIVCGVNVTYENGAVVNTSFTTNLDEINRIRVSSSLHDAVADADRRAYGAPKDGITQYDLPDNVMSAARVSRLSKLGQSLDVKKTECAPVSRLDNDPVGIGIFGGGFILSDEAAAAVAAAAAAAAKDKVRIELSERELKIVEGLNGSTHER